MRISKVKILFLLLLTTSSSLHSKSMKMPLYTDPQDSISIAKQIHKIKFSQPNEKPLVALKTNLLFDAATILNVEFEVPINEQWSIAAEIMFPWWLWQNKQNCLQVMTGNIEGRYWLGDRSKHDLMTGWFVGAHCGGGYYDLERNRSGYQGEFYIAAGASGGYAHTINKRGNLRMEYALGIGYLSTNYRHYEARISELDNEWHLYRQESGHFSWFGPTRLKVSLVWTIDTKLINDILNTKLVNKMLDIKIFKKKGGHK